LILSLFQINRKKYTFKCTYCKGERISRIPRLKNTKNSPGDYIQLLSSRQSCQPNNAIGLQPFWNITLDRYFDNHGELAQGIARQVS
jgi:hypothetical protein